MWVHVALPSAPVETSGNDSFQFSASYVHASNRFITNTLNAYWGYDVYLTAGTWMLGFVHRNSSSMGIVTPSVDGTGLTPVDLYAASLSNNNITEIGSISVATAGTKRIKFQLTSKNASASAYGFYCHQLWLVRTA